MIANARIETIVDRRLYKHIFARHCQSFNCCTYSWYYARCINNRVASYFPIVPTFKPVYYGFVIAVAYHCVTKNTMSCTFFYGFTDSRCSREVHICHPKGNYPFLFFFVPFNRICATSIYKLIEINIFHRYLALPYRSSIIQSFPFAYSS